jgi:hypothetical protein
MQDHRITGSPDHRIAALYTYPSQTRSARGDALFERSEGEGPLTRVERNFSAKLRCGEPREPPETPESAARAAPVREEIQRSYSCNCFTT